MDSQDLSHNLIETIIKNENTQEIFTDVADFSFDQIVDSSLKEIPIIKHILSIAKIGISIRDSFLIKKILAFLKGIPKENHDSLNKFRTRINSDPNYSKKIGEHLIIILDRYDNLTKAEYLSKIFAAYLDEKINLQSFMRLSSSIEKAFIDDLNNLNDYYKKNLIDVDEYILQNLYQSGLVALLFNKINSEVDQIDVPTVFYSKNELGVLFCNVVFDSKGSKLIAPMLNDLENKIFEKICFEEDINKDFVDFDSVVSTLITTYNLTEDGLAFIFSKFEKNSLIERTQKNMMGHYHRFFTSYFGYNYYFQKLPDRKDYIKFVIEALLNGKLRESSGFSVSSNLSQRRVDHLLQVLHRERLITIQKHTHGILVNNTQKAELKDYLHLHFL